MWRRSLRRPGLAGLPAAIQRSRPCPPFHARGGKPRISTLTAQRSSVRARRSALIAATGLGRPPARHLAGTARPAGIVVARPRHHLAIGVGVAVLLGVLGRAVGRRALHRRLRAGGGALAAITLVFAIRLVALALLVVGRFVH